MNNDLLPCPKCGERNYKVWKLPNLLLVHWILNPGLVINELVLGQRIPCEMLECRSCALPFMERCYVPCQACGTLHDGRTWRGRHGFGNWLGMVCPTCGARIPCLWNVWSRVILAVTLPLWYFPVRYYRMHSIPARPKVVELPSTPPVATKRRGVWLGVFWGGCMFIMMTLIPTVRTAYATGEWNWLMLALGAVVCSLGGLAFGWIMNVFLTRQARRLPAKSTKDQPDA